MGTSVMLKIGFMWRLSVRVIFSQRTAIIQVRIYFFMKPDPKTAFFQTSRDADHSKVYKTVDSMSKDFKKKCNVKYV